MKLCGGVLLSILLFGCMWANATESEVYKVNAKAVKMEIRPVKYRMGTASNPNGHTVEALNNYYLSKDKKPWFPVVGEIHYSRYPRQMWEDAILKMKAGGINVIATYCFWIHHEEVNSVETEGMTTTKRNGQTLITVPNPGLDAVIRLKTSSGKRLLRICTNA